MQKIAELAMTAYSDPHAEASVYREALRQVCSLALGAGSDFIRDHEDGRPLVERITTDQARMDTTGDATDSRTAPTEGR